MQLTPKPNEIMKIIWTRHQFNFDVSRLISMHKELACTDTRFAYMYAFHNKRPFPEGEFQIAKSAYFSVKYAQYILQGRFELGEPEIARGWSQSTRLQYIDNVLMKYCGQTFGYWSEYLNSLNTEFEELLKQTPSYYRLGVVSFEY